MTNLKTIKKYEDKVQATQVSKLRLIEDKGNKAIKKVQIDTYKESTLKIALIIGKACEWFESEGRTQMQLDGIKITRLNKEQSEIKGKEIFDKIDAKDAKKQDFVKMFFGYSRTLTFEVCKVYNLNPIVRRKYLSEIAKKESSLKVSNEGLIKFAKGIESGKTAEDMQGEETDEKKASAKAQYVYRDTVNDVQITVNSKGDIKVKGDAIKIEEANEELELDLVESDILAGL